MRWLGDKGLLAEGLRWYVGRMMSNELGQEDWKGDAQLFVDKG